MQCMHAHNGRLSDHTYKRLRSEGHAIGIRDAMQAGICLDAGRALVTRNLRHFERVPELRAVHPERWLLD